MQYMAQEDRYNRMKYQRTGESGLMLPVMSLGMWHNFGYGSSYENARQIMLGSFDSGITHFDLANNYGPPAGAAEELVGNILQKELGAHRDELIISTKAGYEMWPGPYGNHGSKKHLLASVDQSLKRLGIDYVDIFYHHCPDQETPLWETMDALARIVQSGKALYIGLSNYGPHRLAEAAQILENMGCRCLLHQHRYSMLERSERKLLPVIREKKLGSIAYCPLAQGLLTDRYLKGIPEGSRAAGNSVFLRPDNITPNYQELARKLNQIAQSRGQTLAQMALAYALLDGELTSVILGASRFCQIKDNMKALSNLEFSEEERLEIEKLLINWEK